MGVRELKAKYGGNSNTAQTFNRAIRTEFPAETRRFARS